MASKGIWEHSESLGILKHELDVQSPLLSNLPYVQENFGDSQETHPASSWVLYSYM